MARSVAPPLESLRVIADPRRWRLLQELAASDRRVAELTELVGEPQSLVSYHLGELRAAGLVSSRRSSFDGRDTYYRIDLARCADVLCTAGVALDPGLRLGPCAPPAARPRRAKSRVLFLCTGNSARSQMAEALLVERSAHTVEARSAGSNPKPLHPHAVRAMAARGIDISGCVPKQLNRFANQRFDRVITLCDKVREICPEFLSTDVAAHWSVPDPATSDDYQAFVDVADDLEVRIRHLIARLASPEGGPSHAG